VQLRHRRKRQDQVRRAEGRLRPLDRYNGRHEEFRAQGRGAEVRELHSRAEEPRLPNKPAMESLDPELIKKYPTMGASPEALVKYEELQDLGEAQRRQIEAISSSPQRGEGGPKGRMRGRYGNC